MSSRHFEDANHISSYAKFRPSPPAALINAVLDFTKDKVPRGKLQSCIDVGCGSGQSTPCFAPSFTQVLGVDVSPAQIAAADAADKPSNVSYKVCPAETLPLEAASVQLVTSCQACHWFDLPSFFVEADRVLVPGGVLALYGYKTPQFVNHPKAAEGNAIILEFYDEELKDYWAPQRYEVDDGYTAEKFNLPYPDIYRNDDFSLESSMTARDVRGWLSSWSGYQQYCEKKGKDQGEVAINKVLEQLSRVFGGPDQKVPLSCSWFLLMASKPLPEAP